MPNLTEEKASIVIKDDISKPHTSKVSQLVKKAKKLLNIPKHERVNGRSDIRCLLDEARSLIPTGEVGLLSLALQRDCAHLECQLEGEVGNWDRVIESAENALHFIEQMSFHESKEERDENFSDTMVRRNAFIEASTTGYVGYSFMKQKKYAFAIRNLQKSIELFDRIKPNIKCRQSEIVQQSVGFCFKEISITNISLPTLLKFPRTAHLIDMGASTPDDIISSKVDLERICNGITSVVVEEKVDGANLGISMCPYTGKLLAQNRSHYISSNEQTQFTRLYEWLSEHEEALKNLLQPISSELVLYGEWMAARHSIPYHNLPGLFIAFDLYNKTKHEFLSRTRFHTIMQKSGIPVAPIIEVRTFGPFIRQKAAEEFRSDVVRLLERKSRFRSDGGTVEGIILRVDTHDDRWLEERFKIVRGDFIAGCGDGHWSKRKVEKQQVDFEFTNDYTEICYPFARTNRDANRHAIEDSREVLKSPSKDYIRKQNRARRLVPRCVMLMGLPASGKSTFANHLKSNDSNWIHVNQDLMGKKEALEQASKASRKTRVIVDRCHPTVKERQEWLDVMHSPLKADIALVYFSASVQECCERVRNRFKHPTIPSGRGVGIVQRVAAVLEPPSMREKESVFKSVDIVRSFEEAQSLLARWGYG